MSFTFIRHDDYIYYCRSVPQREKPESAQDYLLSLCRMKIGKYAEEVLFDLSSACGTDQKQLWVPFAVDNGRVYLMGEYTGKIVSVLLDGSDCRYLADGSDGILSVPGDIYWHNGFIYMIVQASSVDPTVPASRGDACFLYRIDCNTGEKQRLTDDYVRRLFVCDQYIYYQMTQGLQPTKKQLKESGNKDFSLFTIKQIDHDGSNPASIQLTAPDSSISAGVWGGGNYLFFAMGYRKEKPDGSGATLGRYTMLLNVKDHSVTMFNKPPTMD
jgi:hypothetical protein